MKRLCLALAIALCFSFISCSKQTEQKVETINGNAFYESCISLLKSDNGFVLATCPDSREILNGDVALTVDDISALADLFGKYAPQASATLRVPGNSQELEISINADNALRIYVYKDEQENKALIWLQNQEQSFRYLADIKLYEELKAVLDSAVVITNPSFDGAFISAQLLPGRDIFRGAAEQSGVIMTAHSGYNGKGYVDFYSRKDASVLNSLEFDNSVNRLDVGKKGEIRVFTDGKLFYIDAKACEIKYEFKMPQIAFDYGDSFDVDEKQGLITYVNQGTVYICDMKGKNLTEIMSPSDIQRALPTDVARELDAGEAVIMYKSPRFLKNCIVASASSTLTARPLLALSSFPLEQEQTKIISDEENAAQDEELFNVIHFPNVFGVMGAYLDATGSVAVTSSDEGTNFSNMLSGESWQLSFQNGQRVIVLKNGFVCTQTQELPEKGVRNRVDISHIDSYAKKTQVFASYSTPLTVLGGTSEIVIMREGIVPRLLFVEFDELINNEALSANN